MHMTSTGFLAALTEVEYHTCAMGTCLIPKSLSSHHEWNVIQKFYKMYDSNKTSLALKSLNIK